jgi:hypothetical protein
MQADRALVYPSIDVFAGRIGLFDGCSVCQTGIAATMPQTPWLMLNSLISTPRSRRSDLPLLQEILDPDIRHRFDHVAVQAGRRFGHAKTVDDCMDRFSSGMTMNWKQRGSSDPRCFSDILAVKDKLVRLAKSRAFPFHERYGCSSAGGELPVDWRGRGRFDIRRPLKPFAAMDHRVTDRSPERMPSFGFDSRSTVS